MNDNNEIQIPPGFAGLGISEGESVVIPRAQYEALMAAKEELIDWSRNYDNSACDCMECLRRRKTIAALRAAGIQTEGGGK